MDSPFDQNRCTVSFRAHLTATQCLAGEVDDRHYSRMRPHCMLLALGSGNRRLLGRPRLRDTRPSAPCWPRRHTVVEPGRRRDPKSWRLQPVSVGVRELATSIFKPGMLAPIDLDVFAEACAPQSRLLDFGQTMLARDPQARGDLQLTHGLLGQIDPVLGSELLGSQCRPKICVR